MQSHWKANGDISSISGRSEFESNGSGWSGSLQEPSTERGGGWGGGGGGGRERRRTVLDRNRRIELKCFDPDLLLYKLSSGVLDGVEREKRGSLFPFYFFDVN